MFLNFWSNIRDFFVNLFSKVSFGSIMLLLTGIVIGFVICAFSYLIVILQGIKQADKENKKIATEDDYEKTDEVKKYIRGAKDQYHEEASDLSLTQKIDVMKTICWALISDIAKVYYPDSNYPIYELSIEELLKLSFYITERIDEVFNGKILRLVKNFKIAQIFRLLDAKKKVEDSKIVKASKKLHVGGISKWAFSALNVVNPVYWIKKFMMDVSMNIGMNKITNVIIDIIGQETAKIYSKNIFSVNNEEIEKEIKSLEVELQSAKE